MSDRVVVMTHGRVQQIGTPLEIYGNPRDEFVATFVGQSNLLRCRVVEKRGNVLTAETDCQTKLTVLSASMCPGDSLLLLIRPELIELGPPEVSGINCFRGRIQQLAYMGAFFEYRVDAAGQNFLVQQPAGRHSDRYLPGSEVTVRWDPAVVVCLNENQGVAADQAKDEI